MITFDYRKDEFAPFGVSVKIRKINTRCLLYGIRPSVFDRTLKVRFCMHPEVVEDYLSDKRILLGCGGCDYHNVRDYPRFKDVKDLPKLV